MPNVQKIVSYFHCKMCESERPRDVAPKDWQRISAGITEGGMQVWCDRHECNVVDITLNGDNWTWDDSISLGVAPDGQV